MPVIELSASLPADQRAVWDVVSDPARFEEWLTLHRGWRSEVPRELRVGTQATAVMTLLNLPIPITWTIEHFEPPERLTLSGTALGTVRVELDLDVTNDGPGAAVLDLTARVTGQLADGPLGPAIETAARTELNASADRLRGTLSPLGR